MQRSVTYVMDSVWSGGDGVLLISVLTASVAVLVTSGYIYWTKKTTAPVLEPDESSESEETEEDKLIKEELMKQEVKRLISIGAAKDAETIISANMSEEQRKLELSTQRKQLEEIFRVMRENEDKFGETSLNELVDQMKLYR